MCFLPMLRHMLYAIHNRTWVCFSTGQNRQSRWVGQCYIQGLTQNTQHSSCHNQKASAWAYGSLHLETLTCPCSESFYPAFSLLYGSLTHMLRCASGANVHQGQQTQVTACECRADRLLLHCKGHYKLGWDTTHNMYWHVAVQQKTSKQAACKECRVLIGASKYDIS